MASFDFIDAAVKGYKFLWRERGYITRLAVPLLVIKFASYVFVASTGLEGNVLRQGLIYLPSYFVEGWLLAQLIRLALFGERWPMLPTEANQELLVERSRAVQAGVAVYVLIQLVLAASSGIIAGHAPAPGGEIPPPTFGTFLAGFAALALMVWAFRLIWLHIPAAMGYSVAGFLKKASGYLTSVYMIGTWLICLLPPAMLAVLVSDLLLSLLGEEEVSTFYRFALIALQAVVEIIVAVITTIGLAHGVQSIVTGMQSEA